MLIFTEFQIRFCKTEWLCWVTLFSDSSVCQDWQRLVSQKTSNYHLNLSLCSCFTSTLAISWATSSVNLGSTESGFLSSWHMTLCMWSNKEGRTTVRSLRGKIVIFYGFFFCCGVSLRCASVSDLGSTVSRPTRSCAEMGCCSSTSSPWWRLQGCLSSPASKTFSI